MTKRLLIGVVLACTLCVGVLSTTGASATPGRPYSTPCTYNGVYYFDCDYPNLATTGVHAWGTVRWSTYYRGNFTMYLDDTLCESPSDRAVFLYVNVHYLGGSSSGWLYIAGRYCHDSIPPYYWTINDVGKDISTLQFKAYRSGYAPIYYSVSPGGA